MATFENPEFSSLPSDIADDFNDCFQDNVADIQACICDLSVDPNEENVHQLFRHMHSLKGNCTMVNLDQAAQIVHVLEDLVTNIRAGHYDYNNGIGDLILEVIVQVEQLISAIRQTGVGSQEQVDWLLQLISGVRDSGDGQRMAMLQNALVELGALTADELPAGADVAPVSSLDADLKFFHDMALKIDQLSVYWKRRTEETINLASALNRLLGHVVDPVQLEAALCIHDMGMALVPHNLFNKQTEFTREEQRIVESHVEIGAGMLERIERWQAAAETVRQHHERFDGNGYPQGLKGTQIVPGARILSIVDTFYAVTNERPDRSYRRSLLSAMSEINGNVGTQFDPEYVDAFNQVVREQFIGKRD